MFGKYCYKTTNTTNKYSSIIAIFIKVKIKYNIKQAAKHPLLNVGLEKLFVVCVYYDSLKQSILYIHYTLLLQIAFLLYVFSFVYTKWNVKAVYIYLMSNILFTKVFFPHMGEHGYHPFHISSTLYDNNIV